MYVTQGRFVSHSALCKEVKRSYVRTYPSRIILVMCAGFCGYPGVLCHAGMHWPNTIGRHAHRCRGDSSPLCLISIFIWSQFIAESNRSTVCVAL